MIQPKDITLEHIEQTYVIVLCNFAGIANEWPPFLTYKNLTYYYAYQEAMDANHAKHYAGRARYTRTV